MTVSLNVTELYALKIDVLWLSWGPPGSVHGPVPLQLSVCRESFGMNSTEVIIEVAEIRNPSQY